MPDRRGLRRFNDLLYLNLFLVRFTFRFSKPLWGFYNIQSLTGAWKHALLLEGTMEQESVVRAWLRKYSAVTKSTTGFRPSRPHRNTAIVSRAVADRVVEMVIRPPRA
jgi:hypothetical protein